MEYLNKIEEGYSQGIYKSKKYGIAKNTFNNGKSVKLYANELGGRDFISLNYYSTGKKGLLRPCEMPEEKVIDFLKNVTLLPSRSGLSAP